MPQTDHAGPARSTAVWLERGLAAALTLAFAVALGLRVAEPPEDTRAVQFVLLAAAAVLGAALVAVRRRAAASS